MDLIEEVLTELNKVPAFRGQSVAALEKGIDVKAQISKGLINMDEILEQMSVLHFQKHPELEQAPYAVFLTFEPATGLHNVKVHVGNASIISAKELSSFIIIQGKVERVLTNE